MFKQDLLLLNYNKDVDCVIDKDKEPICKVVENKNRRRSGTNNLPSHDPYIPRKRAVLYNCTSLECTPISLYSITQVSSPKLIMKSCYNQEPNKFECESIRYHYFKNEDKMLFLKNNIDKKVFYLVDCLVYADRGRICHRKEDNTHAKLVDTGTIVRPKEGNVLSQEEFLCEETNDTVKIVNCDLDPYVPYDDGLRLKDSVKIVGDVLLKSGNTAVILKKNCINSWCGYSGSVAPTRRGWFERYEPPGGAVFRCYYANHQQVCKMLYSRSQLLYNERNWLDVARKRK